MSDDLRERRKGRRLRDDVDERVGVGFPALAPDDPSRVASARGVARARDCDAEAAVGILRIFLEWTVGQPLLIAQLHAAKVQHAVLHGAGDALPATALFALKEGGEDPGDQMDAGSRVADLGARD